MALDRYQEMVPNWEQFLQSHQIPEPVAIRVRGPRTEAAALVERLEGRGFSLDSVPGIDGFHLVRGGPGSIAQTLEHWLGLFHIQQAVMALPSLALDPAPGERVLDLCAAPGGKTTHLAELMQDEGPLVAVDPKEKRLRGLLSNIYRLGIPNVVVVAADGRTLPTGALFDRILVDAPCSGEGNIRRQGRQPHRSPDFDAYVTNVQEDLLRRAVSLTRPGGSIVYSTCTYAPEENEAVVHRVLEDCPVRLEPIPLDLPHAPGVTSWRGRRFRSELELAWRVYPHHLDSGGLFMARMIRLPNDSESHSEPAAWTAVPEAFPGEDLSKAGARIRHAKADLESRFGYRREWLDELSWMARGKHLWVHTARVWPVDRWRTDDPGAARWRVVSVGLRALRGGPEHLETPTSHFLTRWPDAIPSDRKINLEAPRLLALLRGGRLEVPDLPAGPVALVWDGQVLGRGMVGRGGLRHELGGAYADRLRAILKL